MSDPSELFRFHSDAVDDDTFDILGFEFEERMSAPFTVTLDLVTTKKPEDIKFEDLIKEDAYLEMKHGVPLRDGSSGTTTRRVYGMISSFQMMEKVGEFIRCEAVLVPRLWKLSLTRESRVFQKLGIQDLVEKVLTDKDSHQFTSNDFEFKLGGDYPEREFIVQYNESDLDFLHRWLEQEGVYYFFGHSEERKDYPIFADSTDAYVASMGTIRYRPPGDLRARRDPKDGGSGMEEAVSRFVCRFSKLPASVKVKDYNYRTPTVEMEAEADVEQSSGVGTVYEYGEHFKTPEEGKAIAKVRAEAIKWREKVFEGLSDCRPFRPGAIFSLEEHFNSDFNADYVILSVKHHMSREFSGGSSVFGPIKYENEFECIPASVVFRPERKTEWPVVGTLNALVDAGGDGKYAEIDSDGRYKVKLPFDLSDLKDGQASRYIRMAQPYAGEGMGMHFPLHKNTEVLINFVDGDPDRPIIMGSVPNAKTLGPVGSKNQTQCAIHTGGGTQMVIEDTDGSQRLHLKTPTKNTYFQMGSKSDDGGGSKGEGGGTCGAASPGSEEGVSMGTDADINFQSAKDYIHRTGGKVVIETAKDELKITHGNSAEETDGDKREWTKGNSYEETVGNSTEKTTGNKDETTIGNSTETTVGNTDETFTGIKTSKSLSIENEMTLGIKNSMSVSAENEMAVGAKSEIFAGIKFESTMGLSIEANKGGKIELCDMEDLKKATEKSDDILGPYDITAATFSVKAGTALELDAKASLKLTCGASEITMTPTSISIKSPTVTIEGSGTLTVQSDGSTTVKGSMVQISGQVMAG